MRKIPQNFMLGGQLDMSYWLELPLLHFFAPTNPENAPRESHLTKQF